MAEMIEEMLTERICLSIGKLLILCLLTIITAGIGGFLIGYTLRGLSPLF